MAIRYVNGDATRPQGSGSKVIVHCVNDMGGWGAGFVLAIDKRWPIVGKRYRLWAQREHKGWPSNTPLVTREVEHGDPSFHLGAVQFVLVEPGLWVANLVGQHRTARDEAVPVRYEALRMGFGTVATFCHQHQVSVHAPRLGAGLARGNWSKIEKLIEAELLARGVAVTIYDLPSGVPSAA